MDEKVEALLKEARDKLGDASWEEQQKHGAVTELYAEIEKLMGRIEKLLGYD